ncbi:FtsB family cell division protein [Klugiella xanthotipulae]|nr:septum formation initiator family protein [Klugiella xanthotipulae]
MPRLRLRSGSGTSGTSGTPPRRSRAEAAPPAESASELRSWFRGLRFSGFSIIMMGLLALGIVILSPSLSVYLDQRQQITELQESVRLKQEALDNATDEQKRWQDPSFVRSEARNRLFYVMRGETQLVVIDDVQIPANTGPVATPELRRTETDWVEALAYSVLASGTTTKDAQQLQDAGTTTDEESE